MAGKRQRNLCEKLMDMNKPRNMQFIKQNLVVLQSKCNDLTKCINKLLSQQDTLSVLQGDNLELKKICQLANVKNNSTESMLDGKCSRKDRLDIMGKIEKHLTDKLENKDKWENVAVCLENNYGDEERTTYAKDLCGLAESTDQVCSYQTHQQVEDFFNEQIDHLLCTCKAVNKYTTPDQEDDEIHIATIIGIALGGLLLLCFVFGLVFYCCRRKAKRRKRKKGPSVIYMPPSISDNCPVYQEIYDQRSPPLNPPTLPSRYNSRPLPGRHDDTEYLEPVQAQAASGSYRAKAPAPLQRLVNNPGYNVEAPPEYSETDQMYEEPVILNTDEANVYFDPIVTPKEKADGYDTLNVRENNIADDHTSLSDQYQPLEDVDRDKKLGPQPAQRTKKEDREAESEYFELERDDQEVHTLIL